MFRVISYDIPNDRRRNQLSRALKNFGERVQFSVFECLLDQKQFDYLLITVKKIIQEEEDSVRIYSLCSGCEKTIRVMGLGIITQDQKDYFL